MARKAAASLRAANAKRKVDHITLSVVRGILETTQREMTLALEQTARSSDSLYWVTPCPIQEDD